MHSGGVIGRLYCELVWGWTPDLATLVLFMGVDFVTGLIVAGVFNKSNKSVTGAINSKAIWRGLCKKLVTLFMVVVAYRMDIMLGVHYLRTATIIGFVTNEGISIIENGGLMGIIPTDKLKKAIELLKTKDDEGDSK